MFALLAHKDGATLDPLNVGQWRFYVLATSKLEKYERSQHSITLKSLEGLCGNGVEFPSLHDAVLLASAENKALLSTPSLPPLPLSG